MTWTKEDAQRAIEEGWLLAEVYEAGKIEWVVLRDDKQTTFATDLAARLYVQHRAQNNDALATKAVRLVFHSKTNFKNTRRKR